MPLLTFPADSNVGRLQGVGIWREHPGPVLAIGEVEVPEGVSISLEVGQIEGVHRRDDGSWAWTNNTDVKVDLGFVELMDPQGLESLQLHGRCFDPESVRHIPHLAPGLKRLYLAFSELSDDGLKHIALLHGLTYLQTWGNSFTDEAVQQLSTLTELEDLYLEEETLTAKAFDFAANLPNLRRLGLQDVSITPEEADALRSRLPRVQVG